MPRISRGDDAHRCLRHAGVAIAPAPGAVWRSSVFRIPVSTYTEAGIEALPSAAEDVKRWVRGCGTVPTFVIGQGRVIVDWDHAAVESALAAVTGALCPGSGQ